MIILKSEQDGRALSPEQFRNEAELQETLADHPQLLVDEHEPDVALVGREIGIPGAGPADLLLVDTDGLPIVVEVKLARNAEIRRQVVAQVFDYVSALSQMTVDELDVSVDGDVESALRSLGPESAEQAEFERRWHACGANLRAGRARVVVAVDTAPTDLTRMLRFMNDHSDLDVRLVAVRKCRSDAGLLILLPNLLVRGDTRRDGGGGRTDGHARLELLDVVKAYDAEAELAFRTRGQAADYRRIQPPKWPSGMHYQFRDRGPGHRIVIDIRLERRERPRVAAALAELRDQIAGDFRAGVVEWRPRKAPGTGTLRVKLPLDSKPQVLAEAMGRLIRLTLDPLNKALHQEQDLAKVASPAGSPVSPN